MLKDVQYIGLESAARIAGISERRARRWARDGILVPSVVYNRDARRHSFIYSRDDIVALRAIGELSRQFRIPLETASEIGRHIQSRNSRPWDELIFTISGKQVQPADTAPEIPDGSDTIVFPIAPIAEAVASQIEQLSVRNPENIGKIERRRDVMGGQPVVKGTRVPVSTVINLAAAGWDIDRIVTSYPSLVPDDVRGVLQLAEEHRQVA